VENRYAGLVRGSSAIFPRGYLWLIPLWYAVVAAMVEFKARPPSWYSVWALGAMALATCTAIAVLVTTRNNAFLADDGGILLGLRAGARRRFGRRRQLTRYLPWPEVHQLKIAARRYGACLEVLPAAPAADRRRMTWQVVLRVIAAGLTAAIPPAYLLRAPGLVWPRLDPPRYRIPLYHVTAEELRVALAPLAPPTVPIAVLPRWQVRALSRRRRSRLTTAA